MALLGQGAVVIWGDLGELDRAVHDHWHSNEHLPERVAQALSTAWPRGRWRRPISPSTAPKS